MKYPLLGGLLRTAHINLPTIFEKFASVFLCYLSILMIFGQEFKNAAGGIIWYALPSEGVKWTALFGEGPGTSQRIG
jgi:hypothetical protein